MNNDSLAGMNIKTPHAYRDERCGTRNSQRSGTEERRRQLIQMTVDDLGDLFFGDGAYDLVGDLATLEDQKRGDASDIVPAGGIDVFIDVQLNHFELTSIGSGDLSHGRRQ